MIPIFGKRAFRSFLLIALLAGGILAAVNIVSRYALKVYTEEQLNKIPWDVAVYQFEELPQFTRVTDQLLRLSGVQRVESVGLLRVQLTQEMLLEIGGNRVHSPWISLVSASNLNLLPPELRSRPRVSNAGRDSEVVLAMLGPQKLDRTYLSQIGSANNLKLSYRAGQGKIELLSAEIGEVVQLERTELVKWLLRETGSTAFIPQLGLIVGVPMDRFVKESARFSSIFRNLTLPAEQEGVKEPELSEQLTAAFLPEVDHLISLDHRGLISGWNLPESHRNASEIVRQIKSIAERADAQAVVNSDLLLTLQKLMGRSRLNSSPAF